MPYTRVTRTANGAAAIFYAINSRGHNGSDSRNELVTLIKMHSQIPAHIQMEKYWNRARPNHKIQIIRIVQSFSKKEFDPNDPADILKVNEIGQAMVDEHFPDRQALVCTQSDGKGGCLHNHILVNDVSINDNLGCKNEQYYQPVLRVWTDEITARYTNLDQGSEHTEKLTQAERAKREKGEYSYKDDLRQRISSAMRLSISEEDFLQKLTANGVNAIRKNSKKYGEHYVYELTDTSAVPENTKLPNHALHARSYKLGTDYGPQALRQHLEILDDYILKSEAKVDSDAHEPEIDIKASVSYSQKTDEETEVDKDLIISAFPVRSIAAKQEETHEDIRRAITNIEQKSVEEEKQLIQLIHTMENARTKRKRRRTAKTHNSIDRGRFDRPVAGQISDIDSEKNKDDFELS